MDSKQVVGERIKAKRKELGMTQSQLATKTGLTADWICNIERGHRRPELETMLQIAMALSVSMDYLCGNSTNHNQQDKGQTNAKKRNGRNPRDGRSRSRAGKTHQGA